MARVTVEDCVLRVPNRFELVSLAAQRARDISSGSPLTLDRDRDKNPVVALREIADHTIDLDHLTEEVIQGLQKHVERDAYDEAEVDVTSPATAATGEESAPEDDEFDVESLRRELEQQAVDFQGREESEE